MLYLMNKINFINKQATRVTGDFAMMFWEGSSGRRKASSNKCFNCQKYGHFGRDCRLSNQRPPEQRKQRKRPKTDELAKTQQPARNRAHIAAAATDDNSDTKLFCPGIANMVKESSTRMQPL